MRIVSILTVFLLLIGLAACDSSGSGGSTITAPNNFNSDSFAIVDADDAFANIQEATLEREISMKPVFPIGGGEFFRSTGHPRGPGSHLAPILFRLGLDLDQMRQLRAILQEHRRTVREALEGLREANAELLEKANAERRAIVEAYRAGEIDREEVIERLRELNERTREAIRNNPANDEILRQICESRKELFEQIRSILSGDQVAEWDSWVAGLDRECFLPRDRA